MKGFTVGPIVGKSLKLRYSTISTFLGEDFNPLNGFDIFIDLNGLVTALSTSSKFLTSLPFSDGNTIEQDLISNILSVVSPLYQVPTYTSSLVVLKILLNEIFH